MTLASTAATVPFFLERSALAMTNWDAALSSAPGVPEDHVLVVVQLAGGNDGLNTVVPYSSSRYYTARPTIGIPEKEILKLGSTGVGLHPKLAGLKSLYDDGLVSIVQGVGYPNPNRSHFKSMDIWHTARTDAHGKGWLGRYFDNECGGAPSSDIGVAIGAEAPLAMQGAQIAPVTFESADAFQWRPASKRQALSKSYNDIMREGEISGVAPGSNADYLMRTALDARLASDRIRKAVDRTALVDYPRSNLASQLKTVAAMIRAGLPTRVYYVTISGFDTHAAQGAANGRHGNRLAELGSSLRAFSRDLKASGDDVRTLTMVFSEFGRRVGQNASGGTDHGAAAPMLLVGPMVRPGVLNRHPSLSDLDSGDLKFSVDFRSVYAAALEHWMGADARAILGRRYPRLNAIKKI